MDDKELSTMLLDVKDKLLKFSGGQLQNTQPRDDYWKLLEFSVIFLGGITARGIRFIPPGATHHAQWMNKVLYSLDVHISV